MNKFELGQCVATMGVDDCMNIDDGFRKFVLDSIDRYHQCDWGDTCEEDKKLNDNAVKSGSRILAVYIYPKDNTKIWIITEWDRSATTVLFPSEY